MNNNIELEFENNDDEYLDVTDDEIYELLSNYPELIDASYTLRDTFIRIEKDRCQINNITFN